MIISFSWSILIVACFSSSVSTICSDDFEGQADYPYKKYQFVTAYDESGRGNISQYQVPAGCQPLAMVLITRHGSRYRPLGDEEGKFVVLESLRNKTNNTGLSDMCHGDLQKIQLWENWYQSNLESNLSPLGEREMTGLGKRFSQTFPQIFSNSSRFKFLSSDYQRTRESARIFMGSSYNSTQSVIVSNSVIRPYDECQRYQKEVTENEQVLAEKYEFAQGEVFSTMASDVAKRLGISETEIGIDTLDILHQEGCAEEEIDDGMDSPWCLVFTKENLQAFEYRDDMGDYMRFGFGIELSYKSACPTKRYILSALKNISDGDSLNHYLFGHGFGLIRTLADMKLIPDDGPFHIEDYPDKVNRSYRASIYTPMSGNVAFLVNQCADGKKLQVFHNEKPLSLPLNDPVKDGTWDLDAALDYFGLNDPHDCDWDILCSLRDEQTNSPTTVSEQTTSHGYPTNWSCHATSTVIFLLLEITLYVRIN